MTHIIVNLICIIDAIHEENEPMILKKLSVSGYTDISDIIRYFTYTRCKRKPIWSMFIHNLSCYVKCFCEINETCCQIWTSIILKLRQRSKSQHQHLRHCKETTLCVPFFKPFLNIPHFLADAVWIIP